MKARRGVGPQIQNGAQNMTKEVKEKKAPTHGVYVVQGDSDNSRWFKIGAAWQNKDGKGMNLMLDALPLTGKIVVREFSEKDPGDKGAEA
jgi:hypothetical protein